MTWWILKENYLGCYEGNKPWWGKIRSVWRLLEWVGGKTKQEKRCSALGAPGLRPQRKLFFHVMESLKRTHGLILLVFTFPLPHPVLLFPKNLSEGGSQEKIANQSRWTELVSKFQRPHCFAHSHLINTARSLLSHPPSPLTSCWPHTD